MEWNTIAVESEEAGKRIDVFLSENFEDLSRNAIQKLIQEKNILINEKECKANYKIRKKDLIQIQIPEPEEWEILPEEIPLDILYEDESIIVVNKPQGMVVHPAPGHRSGTLVNALLYHCKGSLSGINGILRPGIVHRIDKDTSGILMAAKTNLAHQSLARQLADHRITRKYNAIVFHTFKEQKGTIHQPIGRHPVDRKKMTVTKNHSRDAITHYQILEEFKKFTLIEAQLETGRTHQIRVHMAYIGHPLLGDLVYGPKKQPFHLEGQTLHARVLGFVHPVSGKYMEFETELPEYFQAVLKKVADL